MSARQLLWTISLDSAGDAGIPWMHVLPANDAGVIFSQFRRSRIRVPVHFLHRLAVAENGAETLEEVARRHEQVSNDVNGETVEHKEHEEECNVYPESECVCKTLATMCGTPEALLITYQRTGRAIEQALPWTPNLTLRCPFRLRPPRLGAGPDSLGPPRQRPPPARVP